MFIFLQVCSNENYFNHSWIVHGIQPNNFTRPVQTIAVLEDSKTKMTIPCFLEQTSVVNNMTSVQSKFLDSLGNLNCTILVLTLSVCVIAIRSFLIVWKTMGVGWVQRLDSCISMCYRCHALNWQMAEFASKEPFGEGASKKSKDKLQN